MSRGRQDDHDRDHDHDRGRGRPLAGARGRAHEIIFEADTPAGKAFDVALLGLILLSVVIVMLESVESVRGEWGLWLRRIEWSLTIVFTVEYALRLWCVARPLRYAASFFGLVDLLSIAPAYLSLIVSGGHPLLVIRTLRLIRAFRIFKLHQYVAESQALLTALRATKAKIGVFVLVVMTVVLILGSLMYVVEGPTGKFSSIPISVYWAIVTMTTVGYGDLAPETLGGRFIASVAMILGYCIIIVPTGIFSVEIIMAQRHEISTQACPHCSREGHDTDAQFCKHCGGRL